MIVSSDTALVLYSDCKRLFAIDTYLAGTEPKGEVTTERVIVKSKEQKPEKIWAKNFVEVNIVVPDEDGEESSIRLQELERMAHGFFDGGVAGEYDGTAYHYSPESIGIEDDTHLNCHYVNVRILFETLNVR